MVKYSSSEPSNPQGYKFEDSSKRKTRIIVQCDAGFPNTLFLRGDGVPGLNWQKGTALTNVKKDEWVWETTNNFQKGEIKILINDKQYEVGENHHISPGASIRINPKF